MKLHMAMRMAACCGISNIGEAVDNVVVNAYQLFLKKDVDAEIKELYADVKKQLGKDWRDCEISEDFIEEELKNLQAYLAASIEAKK